MRSFSVRLALIALIASLAGCASDLRVTAIQLGRSVNADNTVASHTTTFKPSETVYVSVHTAGSGSGTLSVRWSYAGRVVGEPKKEISYRGAAATEFHLQNAGGFPPGDYSVEAFLNGQSAGVKEFRVEGP
jgi:hypothetical protein